MMSKLEHTANYFISRLVNSPIWNYGTTMEVISGIL